MEFWIFFVCVCIGFVFLERLVPEQYKRFVPMALMFFITFISAFRYRIGWDYDSYVEWFYLTEIGDVYPEYSFQLLSTFFRSYGFDYQVIFIVYSLLTSLFLWKGLKYYFGADSYALVLSIISYTLIKQLYWSSFSGIRQFLALAIFFWGCQFIIKNNIIKYILTIFIAACIHFSSIVLIVCYFIPHTKRENKFKHIFLVFIAIVFMTLGVPKTLMHFVFYYVDIYSQYMEVHEVGLSVYVATFFWAIMIILTSEKYKSTPKQILSINLYTLSIISMWIFSFSSAMYRISLYFQIFQVVQTVFFVYSSKNNCKNYILYITLFAYSALFFKYLSLTQSYPLGILHSYISANNINYAFNFKLFR